MISTMLERLLVLSLQATDADASVLQEFPPRFNGCNRFINFTAHERILRVELCLDISGDLLVDTYGLRPKWSCCVQACGLSLLIHLVFRLLELGEQVLDQ